MGFEIPVDKDAIRKNIEAKGPLPKDPEKWPSATCTPKTE